MPGSLRALIRAGFLVGVAAYLGIASGCKKADEQSTWTRPSIGSMLTSLQPRTLGIYKEKDEALERLRELGHVECNIFSSRQEYANRHLRS